MRSEVLARPKEVNQLLLARYWELDENVRGSESQERVDQYSGVCCEEV
jgi:hypothetical protein